MIRYRLILEPAPPADYAPGDQPALDSALAIGAIEYNSDKDEYYSYLSQEEYNSQFLSNGPWTCPVTGIKGRIDEKYK